MLLLAAALSFPLHGGVFVPPPPPATPGPSRPAPGTGTGPGAGPSAPNPGGAVGQDGLDWAHWWRLERDLYLWDPLVSCDTNVAGPGTGTGALSVGFSVSDDEQVTYTNTTGAAQVLIIEVDMVTGGGGNDYDC